MKQKDFLQKLQQEAQLQAQLQSHRLLPQQLDGITSFIGRYSWQVIFVLSGLTALVLRFKS